MLKLRRITLLLLILISSIVHCDSYTSIIVLQKYNPNIEQLIKIKSPKSWCSILTSPYARKKYFKNVNKTEQQLIYKHIQNILDETQGVNLQCQKLY